MILSLVFFRLLFSIRTGDSFVRDEEQDIFKCESLSKEVFLSVDTEQNCVYAMQNTCMH